MDSFDAKNINVCACRLSPLHYVFAESHRREAYKKNTRGIIIHENEKIKKKINKGATPNDYSHIHGKNKDSLQMRTERQTSKCSVNINEEFGKRKRISFFYARITFENHGAATGWKYCDGIVCINN